jgi:activator of 2-hydroxyglutaryl-CoA dehydratase
MEQTCKELTQKEGGLTRKRRELTQEEGEVDELKKKKEHLHQQQMNQAQAADFEWCIGIDFGTTFSRVAVWLNGNVQIIHNLQDKDKTPSCVAFTE